MRHYDADARSFHTDTFSGVVSAWVIALFPASAVATGIYYLSDKPVLGWSLIVVGLVLIGMFVAPMWATWLLRVHFATRRAQHESGAQIVAMDKEIELEHARRSTAEALAKMEPANAMLAREWVLAPPIKIMEASVMWEVNGVSVPITFTLEWLAKWEQRGRGRELPADRDWTSPNDRYRDLKRSYNRAIRHALTKRGLVRDVTGGSGGPFPARFLSKDTDSALGEIGFWLAYELAKITIEGE